MTQPGPEQSQPVPLSDVLPPSGADRVVDGVPVRTYRGASLAELAPRIRAELGDSAMILRQREGVTGGIAGFFAKRTVEVDVAVLNVPGSGHVDFTDEDAPVGPLPGAAPARPEQPAPAPSPPEAPAAEAPAAPPQATVPFDALRPPLPEHREPAVPFSAFAEQHGLPTAPSPATAPDAASPSPGAAAAQPAAAPAPTGAGQPLEPPAVPSGPAPGANPYTAAPPSGPPAAFTVGAPSAQDAAGIEAALRADQAQQAAERAQHAAERARAAAERGSAFQPLDLPPAAEPALPPATLQPAAEPAAPQHPPASVQRTDPAEPGPYVPQPIDPAPATQTRDAAPLPPVPAFRAAGPPPYEPPAADEPFDAPFDPGRRGAAAAPVAPTSGTFEEHLRTAGLDTAARSITDPVAELTPLHAALLRRGLPDQIASPVTDDTLCHRVPLQPDRPARELLASELARRIPTAPLAGRTGQAVAFVGSSGAGKTRAIARLAAAYGAAGRVPVACVTLHSAGDDGLLASALAPYGIAVHAAPDAPRALDRITALRRHALVLVDTPGVSPGDRHALDRLGATLELLELDQVALCLPVVLSAPIARRVLRAMRPLGPTALVATHADEADLLGGVVAVAIDRRMPVAYVSSGAGRGRIVGADAQEIASGLIGAEDPGAHALSSSGDQPPTAAARASRPIDTPAAPAPLATEPPQDERPPGPAVDVAAGAAHIAAPWIVSTPLRDRRSRRK